MKSRRKGYLPSNTRTLARCRSWCRHRIPLKLAQLKFPSDASVEPGFFAGVHRVSLKLGRRQFARARGELEVNSKGTRGSSRRTRRAELHRIPPEFPSSSPRWDGFWCNTRNGSLHPKWLLVQKQFCFRTSSCSRWARSQNTISMSFIRDVHSSYLISL